MTLPTTLVPPTSPSRSPAMMVSPSPPSQHVINRQSVENDGDDESPSHHSEDMSSLPIESELSPTSSTDGDSHLAHHATSSPSPLSRMHYFRQEDTMELSDDVDAVSASAAGEEGDTIEDIMNTPCTTIVPAPVQDFSSLYHHEPMSDETEQMRRHRELIQEKLRKQLLAQESGSKTAASSKLTELYTPRDSDLDEEDSVDDTDVLYSLDGVSMQTIDDAEEPLHDLLPKSISIPDEPVPLLPDNTAPQASTSSLKRSLSSIELTPNLSTTPSTHAPHPNPPSPSKRRRKTSSPAELAALAHAAAIQQAETAEAAALRDLEQYRDMDLTPLEPIMESSTAGDLMVHGTPAKALDADIFQRGLGLKKAQVSGCPKQQQRLEGGAEGEMRRGLSTEHVAIPPLDDEVRQEMSDTHLVPPFIAVVEMLPATVFWCVVAAVAHGGLKAFDALVERLTGLRV